MVGGSFHLYSGEFELSNPFENRISSLSGPATDIVPVTPNDTIDLQDTAIALYVESGGVVSIVTQKGGNRSVIVSDNSILPVGTTRVHATGTTAAGIHAMVIS